ncbi:hypothetical protein [uncultured Faecalibaculum sp.]|uniref:hypothetical protein n=2 Tax=uncultured Faecalibaculum sp. TaxID=1729681 RepID=UPI0025EC7AA9|nr:hypothetical protein [uncultured Faecalibaculum sp.]
MKRMQIKVCIFFSYPETRNIHLVITAESGSIKQQDIPGMQGWLSVTVMVGSSMFLAFSIGRHANRMRSKDGKNRAFLDIIVIHTQKMFFLLSFSISSFIQIDPLYEKVNLYLTRKSDEKVKEGSVFLESKGNHE